MEIQVTRLIYYLIRFIEHWQWISQTTSHVLFTFHVMFLFSSRQWNKSHLEGKRKNPTLLQGLVLMSRFNSLPGNESLTADHKIIMISLKLITFTLFILSCLHWQAKLENWQNKIILVAWFSFDFCSVTFVFWPIFEFAGWHINIYINKHLLLRIYIPSNLNFVAIVIFNSL